MSIPLQLRRTAASTHDNGQVRPHKSMKPLLAPTPPQRFRQFSQQRALQSFNHPPD